MRANVTVRTLLRILQASWVVLIILLGLPVLGSTLSRQPLGSVGGFGQEARPQTVVDASTAIQKNLDESDEMDPDLERARSVIDEIERSFDRTLDYAPLLDTVFLSDAVDLFATSETLGQAAEALRIDPALVANLDPVTKRRILVNYANTSQLVARLQLDASAGEGPDGMADSPDSDVVDGEIEGFVAKSPLLARVVNDDTDESVPVVTTRADLHDLIGEWERLNDYLRSKIRRPGIGAEGRNQILGPLFVEDVTGKDEDLNFAPNDRVFTVSRNNIAYILVKRDGEFKLVVCVLIGD